MTVSKAVKRTGKSQCDLCRRVGTEKNPLTRHHADGNPRNHDPVNYMVLHRTLCHTFGDFITQFYSHYGVVATPVIIKQAWQSFTWKGESMVYLHKGV